MTFWIDCCRHCSRVNLIVTDLDVRWKGWELRLSVHNIEGDRIRWHALVPVESSWGIVLDLKLYSNDSWIRREIRESGCHFIWNAVRINCYKSWQCWNGDNSIGSRPIVLDQGIRSWQKCIIEDLLRCNGHRWKGRAAKAWVGISLKLPSSLFFYLRNDHILRWLHHLPIHHRESNCEVEVTDDQKSCDEVPVVGGEFNLRTMRSAPKLMNLKICRGQILESIRPLYLKRLWHFKLAKYE